MDILEGLEKMRQNKLDQRYVVLSWTGDIIETEDIESIVADAIVNAGKKPSNNTVDYLKKLVMRYEVNERDRKEIEAELRQFENVKESYN